MARTGRPKGTNNKEVNYTLRLDECDIETRIRTKSLSDGYDRNQRKYCIR